MGTTSSNRGLSVPTNLGDSGTWGSELNTTLAALDDILGGTLILQSSASLATTLTSSQAQMSRIVIEGISSGSYALTFASSLFALGNYQVWNAGSTGSTAAGVICQTTGAGTTCTVPAGSMRSVNVDGTNAQFADQVPIPAVTLPPVLNGYISGLILSNDGSTPNSVLDIGAGIATDSTAAIYMQTAAPYTKNTGGTWVAGTGNAGMGVGLSITASTWYHVFIILNNGLVDCYFDTSPTAVNKPASTTNFRRIGSFKTNASAHIQPFLQKPNGYFEWTSVSGGIDFTTTNPGTSPVVQVVNVPLGIAVIAVTAFLVANLNTNPANAVAFAAYDPIVGAIANNWVNQYNAAATTAEVVQTLEVPTNTSSQIGYIFSGSNASLTITGTTIAWIDARGQ